MSQFLYFLPGRNDVPKVDGLPETLRDILHDCKGLTSRRCHGGPGGKSGIIVSVGDDTIGYYPEQQCWHKSQSGDYHIGWFKDKLPTEKELRRTKRLDGGNVSMGNGEEWLVPILHGPGITLPMAYGFGPDGKIDLQLKPGYEDLLAASSVYFDIIANHKPFTGIDEFMRFAVKVVGVNYRIGIEEAAALYLIEGNGANVFEFLFVALGFEAVKEEVDAQKKTDPTQLDGTPGSQAGAA